MMNKLYLFHSVTKLLLNNHAFRSVNATFFKNKIAKSIYPDSNLINVCLTQNLPENWVRKRHLLDSLALFRENGLNYIFFRNKTFLFFKIQSWNFQQLFEREFRETSQNFKAIRQKIGINWNINCLYELKFCEVSRNSLSNSC